MNLSTQMEVTHGSAKNVQGLISFPYYHGLASLVVDQENKAKEIKHCTEPIATKDKSIERNENQSTLLPFARNVL